MATVEAQSPALQLFHAMGEMARQFRSIAKITPQEARNYSCKQVKVVLEAKLAMFYHYFQTCIALVIFTE